MKSERLLWLLMLLWRFLLLLLVPYLLLLCTLTVVEGKERDVGLDMPTKQTPQPMNTSSLSLVAVVFFFARSMCPFSNTRMCGTHPRGTSSWD